MTLGPTVSKMVASSCNEDNENNSKLIPSHIAEGIAHRLAEVLRLLARASIALGPPPLLFSAYYSAGCFRFLPYTLSSGLNVYTASSSRSESCDLAIS